LQHHQGDWVGLIATAIGLTAFLMIKKKLKQEQK